MNARKVAVFIVFTACFSCLADSFSDKARVTSRKTTEFLSFQCSDEACSSMYFAYHASEAAAPERISKIFNSKEEFTQRLNRSLSNRKRDYLTAYKDARDQMAPDESEEKDAFFFFATAGMGPLLSLTVDSALAPVRLIKNQREKGLDHDLKQLGFEHKVLNVKFRKLVNLYVKIKRDFN